MLVIIAERKSKALERLPACLTYCHCNSYDGKLSPGLKALGELPFAAWVQILGAIAVIELTVGKQDYENKVREHTVGSWRSTRVHTPE